MSDSARPLPPRVVQFIGTHITSLLQLEVLLLVFEGGRRARTAKELATEMYLSAGALAGWLDGFVESGFCERDDGQYRLSESQEIVALLSEVADCYLRRRVSVGRLIFGSRDSRHALSEAFRIQKDGER